jgi:hypothetical protein
MFSATTALQDTVTGQCFEDYIDEIVRDTKLKKSNYNSIQQPDDEQLVQENRNDFAQQFFLLNNHLMLMPILILKVSQMESNHGKHINGFSFVGGQSVELATAPLDLCMGFSTNLDEEHLNLDKQLQHIGQITR